MVTVVLRYVDSGLFVSRLWSYRKAMVVQAPYGPVGLFGRGSSPTSSPALFIPPSPSSEE